MRPDLPRGTVTFLFTDIAGSTRLLDALGPAGYAGALASHRVVIREAAAPHGGVEVDTQGDAFFIAFPTAGGGVEAAIAIRDGLAATGPISVRMGLHTGTPLVTDEGYVGPDVHVGARIAATAHGGQIVLSSSTRELLGDGPWAPVVDLGEHRLKDIDGVVTVFQVGDEPFPPLRSIANTNLPNPVSSFLGRTADIEAVYDRLVSGARLVTLTGPGGTGKTRLSIEAARRVRERFPAGVIWVGLATIRDGDLVLPTIAGVIGAGDDLTGHLGSRRMLLVLDNLEQVVDAAPRLAGLLVACPELVLLVTSRISLRVAGEVEIRVGSLAPEDAVWLFTERSGVPPSPDVEELCRRLDGLPLAVELAASRARMLGVRTVLDRLGSRLDLLRGGRDLDPRQQTLRATIAWSDDLLDAEARALFRRLSIFAGGCSLEAAEAVLDADLDVLQSLVEHSLIRFDRDRFWMLETIRAYASDLFADDPDRAAVEAAFCTWAIELVEREDQLVRGPEQIGALERLDREIDNVRAAFELVARGADPDPMRRLAIAAGWWLRRRGSTAEMKRWLRTADSMIGGDDRLRAWVMVGIASDSVDLGAVEARLREAEAIGRATGDASLEASALELRGYVDPSPEGLAMLERAGEIFVGAGEINGRNRVALNLVSRAINDGQDELAVRLARDVDPHIRLSGNRHGIAVNLANRAAALTLLGRLDEAQADILEAVGLFQILGERTGLAQVLQIIAAIEAQRRPGPEVGRLLGAADALLDGLEIEPEPSDIRFIAITDRAFADVDRPTRASWAAEGAALDPQVLIDRWVASLESRQEPR